MNSCPGGCTLRHYYIYSIEDKVAEMFFGEESKLFHLFLEAKTTRSYSRLQILRKQIDYITKPIAASVLENGICNALRYRNDYDPSEGYHLLKMCNSRAALTLTEGCMLMESSGNFEAETTFFEILRRLQRCLLAMDFHEQRYGWLNPIKQTNLV
jgi:hypothetical protein